MSPFPIFPGAQAAQGALVPIASSKLLVDTGGIYFNSIPQTYQDLILVINARATGPYTYSGNALTVNGDSGSNYSRIDMNSGGGSTVSYRVTADTYFNFQQIPGSLIPSSVFGLSILHIPSYASTTAYKSFLLESSNNNNMQGNVSLQAGQWRSTAAITSLAFGTSISYGAGSTMSLYGVRSVRQ